ncbi:glycosyltransferase family 2 protein [Leptolyngbya sp. FACHB-36]|nr:glycosyltransferase family 2 protein [Leptolyngbya sp. FACHB-36]
MTFPTVEEEGVTTAIALWHQRNRWAEGGYQRYLDYWKPILRNRLGTQKTLDLFMFWIIQYLLPTAMVPDLLMSLLRNRPSLLTPLTGLTFTLPMIGIMLGLRQIRRSDRLHLSSRNAFLSGFRTLLHTLFGTLYLFHWLPIIATMTARVAVRPKRLKWVKTIHQGTEQH